MEYFILYLVLINIFTCFLYGIDKIKAKYNKWRISENTLIGMAVIGGFVGAFLGMQIFRHKTQHMKFVIGIPIIAVAWVVVIYFIITRL